MPSFILDQIKLTANEITKRLKGHQFAIRGTASLVLQGLDMGVADIDVLCDAPTAKFFLPDIQYSQSPKHKSYFGKTEILGIPVEVMGNWQIKNSKTGEWSEVFSAAPSQTTIVSGIPVTTIGTELKCVILMGRFSEYHKIKKQLNHLPLDNPQPHK